MTRAFVAGATGYTGREVVRVLRAREIETLAHVRPDSPRLAEWRTRFEALGAQVDATAWKPDALRRTVQERAPTLIFALLGTTRARVRATGVAGGAEAGYAAVDRGLSLMLLAAAAGVTPAPRFVYLSSIGVREGTGNAYLAARAAVEQALREGTVPYTIARPSFITGPDRDEARPAERVAAAVTDGVLRVAGWLGANRLRERYRSATNGELAEALVRLALDPAAAGRTVESEGLRQV